MTGGHAWQQGLPQVDGPDQARKVARLQLRAGADVLKVMATRAGSAQESSGGPELTVEEMQAICEEAHKRGKRVGAHAVGAEGIKNAIRAGVDTIEHGCLLDEECIELMVENGVYLITTLLAYHRQAERAAESGRPEYVAQRSRQIMEAYPGNVRKAWESGVQLALGSDCGIEGLTPHGANATELELIVKLAGISEMKAVELATRGGAEALNLGDQVGTLEVGKVADILVIDGNPLEDINILQNKSRIRMIIKEGEIVVQK